MPLWTKTATLTGHRCCQQPCIDAPLTPLRFRHTHSEDYVKFFHHTHCSFPLLQISAIFTMCNLKYFNVNVMLLFNLGCAASLSCKLSLHFARWIGNWQLNEDGLHLIMRKQHMFHTLIHMYIYLWMNLR
jgi:hypothetical protein